MGTRIYNLLVFLLMFSLTWGIVNMQRLCNPIHHSGRCIKNRQDYSAPPPSLISLHVGLLVLHPDIKTMTESRKIYSGQQMGGKTKVRLRSAF